MKAAEIIYDKNGNPEWDKMWNSFCNLAAEGGPSHRGEPDRIDFPKDNFIYDEQVKNEIYRGLKLLNANVKELNDKGEVYIDLTFPNKAKWFVNIINLENVVAKQNGKYLILPWSGKYEIDKEIKSLMTVWGKASHYWKEHRPIQFKIFIIIFGYDPMIS